MSAKYVQLAELLRAKLPDYAQRSGKLPTEAELCESYGMSRQTVRHSLQLLADEGLIQRRHGSGSYVKRSALRKDTMQIAVITSFLDDYIFPTILHDAQNIFAQEGYSTLVYATENRVSAEREILKKLLNMHVSAILIEGSKTALPTPNADLFMKLRESGIPILFLHGIYSNLPDFPCILDNNHKGGYILSRYLLEKGHRQLGGIFKSDDLQGPQRYQGMVDALRDAQIPVPDKRICWYDTENRSDMVDKGELSFLHNAIKHRLASATAVICYNDEIAHLLIRCLAEAGKRVPEDVAVVSFDNSHYSQIGPVPITSLGHRAARTGRMAAQQLLKLLQGEDTGSVTLDWEIIERQSG